MTITLTEPRWQCQGCLQWFGATRKWLLAYGWLPSIQRPDGTYRHRSARLCEYCYDNHCRYRAAS